MVNHLPMEGSGPGWRLQGSTLGMVDSQLAVEFKKDVNNFLAFGPNRFGAILGRRYKPQSP